MGGDPHVQLAIGIRTLIVQLAIGIRNVGRGAIGIRNVGRRCLFCCASLSVAAVYECAIETKKQLQEYLFRFACLLGAVADSLVAAASVQ